MLVFVSACVWLTVLLLPWRPWSTREFLDGDHLLLPDDVVGWSNRPDVAEGNWQIDSLGSRSSHPATALPGKAVRVLFLGSSMINGGTRVTNRETVAAFTEDADIEALNFGTMMYSLDQVLLSYTEKLEYLGADVIVVGLDAEIAKPV